MILFDACCHDSPCVSDRQTSLDAYAALKDSSQLGRMQLKVLGVLRSAGRSLSHLQIAEILCVHPNNVTGRVNELVKAGLVVEDGFVYNEFTGKRAKAWRLKILQ